MEKTAENFRQLIIRNEAEAFDALKKALNNEIGDEPLMIKFDNWPLVEIKLEGKGYESTITADMAHAIVELQSALNRAYARTIRNSSNPNVLTVAEKESLRFKVKIEKGSSKNTIDLSEQFERIFLGVADRMDQTHLVIVLVGFALAGFSLLAYKHFLDKKSEDKKVDDETRKAITLSQEETKRLEVFAEAMKARPVLKLVNEDFDQARHEIVKGVADAETLSVNSVSISRSSAKTIAASSRTQSKEVQINGNFVILETHWDKDGEVKLRLSCTEDGREFLATLQDDTLNRDQLAILQAAEWNRSTVYMNINAHDLRGEITKATVISVTVQPDA